MLDDELTYVCNSCGEAIVVPVDLTAGRHQEFVEDCPVCCNPNVIVVTVDPDGHASINSASEQDRY